MPRFEKTTAQVIGSRIGNAIDGGGRMTFIPLVNYRYNVNGQEYVNENYTQNPVGTLNRRAIQKVIDRYPANSTIEIFYNVENPAESFVQKGLGRGISLFMRTLLVVSLLVLVVVVIIANNMGIIHLF